MTRTPLRLFAVAAVAAAAALPASAHATGGPPEGQSCRFKSIAVNSDDFTGEIDGGPLVAYGSTISMRCSIHVGNAVHSGPAAAEATSEPLPNVAVVAKAPVTYHATYEDVVAMCTEATVDGTTYYQWGLEWTTDPESSCVVVSTTQLPPDSPPDLPPPLDPVEGYLWCLWYGGICEIIPPIDNSLCQLFQTAAPGVPGVVDVRPDGDIYVLGEFFWDCPPYEVWD